MAKKWEEIKSGIIDSIEIIIGIALTLIFLYTDYADIALLVGILTSFFALTKLTLSQELRKKHDNLVKHLIELDYKLACITEHNNAYRYAVNIRQDKLRKRALDTLKDTERKLQLLSEGKEELSGIEYYTWLEDEMQKCRKKSIILATSVARENSWINDFREQNFFDWNIKVIRDKEVSISRCFITLVSISS